MPRTFRFTHRRRHANGIRRQYVPQDKRISTVQRPLASKYGDELFIKVQKVLPLETIGTGGDVFAYMRQDLATSTSTNIVLQDQPEFTPFIPLYGFYEVRGMKAEMSCADTSRVTGAGLYAGMAPGLSSTAGVPTNEDLVKLPIQTKGNTQGQVFSIYYGFANDLKQQGAQFAIPTNQVYSSGNLGVVIARM